MLGFVLDPQKLWEQQLLQYGIPAEPSTQPLPGLWVPLPSSSRLPSILHAARDEEC